MSELQPAPATDGLVTTIRVLLAPSFIVGLCAALIAVDLAFHVINEPFSQLIGNTVLIGGFLIAPVATLLAVGLAVWHALRHRRNPAPVAQRRPRLWTMIGLSFLCIVGAWVVMASIFQS
jgi:hypothetical protein